MQFFYCNFWNWTINQDPIHLCIYFFTSDSSILHSAICFFLSFFFPLFREARLTNSSTHILSILRSIEHWAFDDLVQYIIDSNRKTVAFNWIPAQCLEWNWIPDTHVQTIYYLLNIRFTDLHKINQSICAFYIAYTLNNTHLCIWIDIGNGKWEKRRLNMTNNKVK